MPERTENDLDIDELQQTCSALDKNLAILVAEFNAYAKYTKLALDKADSLMDARNEKLDLIVTRIETIEKMLSKQDGVASQKSVSWTMFFASFGILLNTSGFIFYLIKSFG